MFVRGRTEPLAVSEVVPRSRVSQTVPFDTLRRGWVVDLSFVRLLEGRSRGLVAHLRAEPCVL